MGLFRPSCMTILFLLILFVLSPSSAIDLPAASGSTRRSNTDVGVVFHTWISKHGKTYNSTLGEKERRFQIFKDNLHFIHQHNAKNLSYRLGLTRFADLTVEEYRKLFTGRLKPKQRALRISRRYVPLDGEQLPESVDWRNQGAVSAIKDQGFCNSCWAFSSVAAVEGINKIVAGELISLSEQELVDCNTDNHGCYGDGLMDQAFEFLINNNIGLDSETNYPYIGYEGFCYSVKGNSNGIVRIDGYEDVPPNDESSLKKAVAHQPVSVGIDKEAQEFMFYTSGVYDGPCGTDLDHAVVIVGYGSENGQDYWIVKNSWGTSWGEDGYVKIARNYEYSTGKCGIAMMPSYPTKKLEVIA